MTASDRSDAVRGTSPVGDVTVVMGTFNGAAHIQEQLDSIADQTLHPAELIVSDDGSDDATVEIVESFSRSAAFPVTLVKNSRAGISRNFLAPAVEVRTRWIAWSDQDDVWYPTKLQRCISMAEATSAVLIFHGADIVDGSLRDTGRDLPQPKRDILQRFEGSRSGVFHGFATVFRASLLDGVDVDGLPASLSHDGSWYHDELVHELGRLSGSRLVLHETLAAYRRHELNVSADVSAISLIDRLAQRHSRADHVRYARDLARWVNSVERFHRDGDVRRYIRRYVKDEEVRAAACDAGTVGARAGAIMRGLLMGSYRSRTHGGHGLTALLRDAATALRVLVPSLFSGRVAS